MRAQRPGKEMRLGEASLEKTGIIQHFLSAVSLIFSTTARGGSLLTPSVEEESKGQR